MKTQISLSDYYNVSSEQADQLVEELVNRTIRKYFQQQGEEGTEGSIGAEMMESAKEMRDQYDNGLLNFFLGKLLETAKTPENGILGTFNFFSETFANFTAVPEPKEMPDFPNNKISAEDLISFSQKMKKNGADFDGETIWKNAWYIKQASRRVYHSIRYNDQTTSEEILFYCLIHSTDENIELMTYLAMEYITYDGMLRKIARGNFDEKTIDLVRGNFLYNLVKNSLHPAHTLTTPPSKMETSSSLQDILGQMFSDQ